MRYGLLLLTLLLGGAVAPLWAMQNSPVLLTKVLQEAMQLACEIQLQAQVKISTGKTLSVAEKNQLLRALALEGTAVQQDGDDLIITLPKCGPYEQAQQISALQQLCAKRFPLAQVSCLFRLILLDLLGQENLFATGELWRGMQFFANMAHELPQLLFFLVRYEQERAPLVLDVVADEQAEKSIMVGWLDMGDPYLVCALLIKAGMQGIKYGTMPMTKSVLTKQHINVANREVALRMAQESTFLFDFLGAQCQGDALLS